MPTEWSCVRRLPSSLRSRRLEVVGERENGRARGRHARGAHYLEAPATQASCLGSLAPRSSFKSLERDAHKLKRKYGLFLFDFFHCLQFHAISFSSSAQIRVSVITAQYLCSRSGSLENLLFRLHILLSTPQRLLDNRTSSLRHNRPVS